MSTLANALDRLTIEGALYERLDDGSVRCFACGHRCLIREGKRGICQVRFNEGGKLRVPWGYVAALQSDPIEKKPFFHVLPGSNALTFGMLGCDFHCGYCFTGDTMVVTDRGPLELQAAFELGVTRRVNPDGEIAFPSNLRAITSSGGLRTVKAVFRHPYHGEMIRLEPYCLPTITCTPDHRVYAAHRAGAAPELIYARDLTKEHYLAVPRSYQFGAPPGPEDAGVPEAELCTLRLPSSSAARPFSRDMECGSLRLGDEAIQLATILREESVGSAGYSFALEAASRVNERLPEGLFQAPRAAVRAFLEAFADGAKFSYATESKEQAYGVAWLALKAGYFPSVDDAGPHRYTVAWHKDRPAGGRILETEEFHLVPIRGIEHQDFQGYVFNMEVEQEHNYLANFLLVSNCQNWLTSQALRDPAADESIDYVRKISPQGMLEAARRTRASVVVSSYNEPLITSEWAVAIFKEAKAAGLKCAYVSNGNNTPEVLEYIRPYIDAYKVDLKSMNDRNYRKLGGVLQHTLDGIRRAHDLGLWVEVVTLVIPGFNDSNEELWEAARFIASVSPEIPWHVTAFHKDYKMTEPDNTPARTLLRAAEIGREAGLPYVYSGNLPGRVEEYEDTFCPNCNAKLIRRSGYVILDYRITAAGCCPACGTRVPGVWSQDPSGVRLNGHGVPIPVY